MTHAQVDDELQCMLDEAEALYAAGRITEASRADDIAAARLWAARAHDKADDLELTGDEEENE